MMLSFFNLQNYHHHHHHHHHHHAESHNVFVALKTLNLNLLVAVVFRFKIISCSALNTIITEGVQTGCMLVLPLSWSDQRLA
jgi:hypothetical protein